MMDWGNGQTPTQQAQTAVIDQNASSGVMIALVPTSTEWCQIACPHLTLVYAGKVEDLKPTDFNELGKEASDLALLSRPITLKVSGTEEFGGDSPDNPAVEVLTLQSSPELRAMRRAVESWNASDWPFNPHVTVGPVGTIIPDIPQWLSFDKLMVSWGEEELIFSLRGGL